MKMEWLKAAPFLFTSLLGWRLLSPYRFLYLLSFVASSIDDVFKKVMSG